jgi:RNA polymerase sigma-70 factor (ECF subfamily)
MIASAAFAKRESVDAPPAAQWSSDTTEAFVRLTRRELDRAYRLAGLILGDAAEAEEAVGDAFERAWRHMAELRDSSRFQAWFDRIVVNECRDRMRRRGRVRLVSLDGHLEQPSVLDPFARVLERDEALRSIERLPPEERVVVVLHYWADLTLEAVAERLGWRSGTVKSRLHRALERMRAAATEATE